MKNKKTWSVPLVEIFLVSHDTESGGAPGNDGTTASS